MVEYSITTKVQLLKHLDSSKVEEDKDSKAKANDINKFVAKLKEKSNISNNQYFNLIFV